jgi:nitrite reductase/ring-hydroxylating ferredoxin subunit
MSRQRVCRVSEITGAILPVATPRGTILLMRLPSGAIKATASRCPHQGANLEYGCVTGLSQADQPNHLHTERAGEILRCPWHGFEFDLVSGVSVIDRGRPRLRLKQFPVEIENDDVFVVL